jgi:HSP20 family protein
MFALNTKKQNKQEVQEKSLAKQGGKALGGWGNWDPFAFSLTPADFFSTSPFVLMRRFSEEMDRSFGRLFSHGSSNSGVWIPAIEMTERDGQLQVRAELPGLKPEDVKVEVTDGALVIEGERKYEHDENKKGVYRSERRYGQFYREIPLPEGADVEQAKARFNNGVLEIKLPVAVQVSKRREIPIASGSSTAPKAAQAGTAQK